MASFFNKSIESKFNRMLLYSLIISLITAIVGLVLLFMPELSEKVIGFIAGAVFLITGANAIYKYFLRDGAKIYNMNIAFGIILLILGIVIIIFPSSVVGFITKCLGIYLIVNGAMKMNYAFWLRRGNEPAWLVTLATGIMFVIFGIMLIFNPFVRLTLTQLVGAFLLIVSALDITDTILFKRRSKEITEIFW